MGPVHVDDAGDWIVPSLYYLDVSLQKNVAGKAAQTASSAGHPQQPSTKAAATAAPPTAKAVDEDALGELMNNPELLRELVAGLPGVDPDSAVTTQVGVCRVR